MLSPQIFLYLSSVLVLFASVRLRVILALLAVLGCAFISSMLPAGDLWAVNLGSLVLHPFHTSSYTQVLLPVLLLVASAVVLYSRNASKWEMFVYLAYIASGVGVVLSADWVSLLVSLELLAVAAVAIVASGGAAGPAVRYAAVHFLAGVLMLSGIALQLAQYGSVDLIPQILSSSSDLSSWLLAAGLLINCASFPLFSWVTDGYTAASAPANALLACFTTKVSLYILLRLFASSETLFCFGAITAVLAIIFAALEDNVRRLLCYGLIGQMGLLMIGVGFGDQLAIDGTVLQIAFGTAYQCLLFIIAGIIHRRTGKSKLTEMGDLLKEMPFTGLCCLIAILAMVAMPGTIIFISKSMITHSVHMEHKLIYYVFVISSLALFVAVGLKFFWFAFVAPTNCDIAITKANPGDYVAASILLALLLGPSFFPEFFVAGGKFKPYQGYEIIFQSAIATSVALLFLFFRRLFRGRVSFTMDLDWLHRCFALHIISLCEKFMLFMWEKIISISSRCSADVTKLEGSGFAKARSSGSTIILSLLLISGVIIFLCLNL